MSITLLDGFDHWFVTELERGKTPAALREEVRAYMLKTGAFEVLKEMSTTTEGRKAIRQARKTWQQYGLSAPFDPEMRRDVRQPRAWQVLAVAGFTIFCLFGGVSCVRIFQARRLARA